MDKVISALKSMVEAKDELAMRLDDLAEDIQDMSVDQAKDLIKQFATDTRKLM